MTHRLYQWLVLGSSVLVLSACDDGAQGAETRVREGCTFTPAPRWVLRDADGSRVDAFVEPRCGGPTTPCRPLDFGSSNSFPEVRVISHEGRYINVRYVTETGTLVDVDGMSQGDWAIGRHWYVDDACAGEHYGGVYPGAYGGRRFLGSRYLPQISGELWYLSEKDCVGPEDEQWMWDSDTMECSLDPPEDRGTMCPFKTVPGWVRDLLPNPPYSLRVEYD